MYYVLDLATLLSLSLLTLSYFFFGKSTLFECYALPIASYWEAIMSVPVTFMLLKLTDEFRYCGPRNHQFPTFLLLICSRIQGQ